MSIPAFKKLLKHTQIYIYLAILFILLLTSINIHNSLLPKKVLGVKTQSNIAQSNEEFWNDFVSRHPEYIPGWIELGRSDKAKEIDPNFIYR